MALQNRKADNPTPPDR